jgi:hypothetical protein
MENGEEPKSDPMQTLLEVMVTTLDQPALAMDDAEAFVHGDNHVMVNISLQCNSPVPRSTLRSGILSCLPTP